MAKVKAMQTLAEFFAADYEPTCLVGARPRTLDEYRLVLNRWQQLTSDPPLDKISGADVARFYQALLDLGLSENTVRKHARHLQPILDAAGPPTRGRRDALGVLDRVPYARPPRGHSEVRKATPAADVSAMYEQAARAVYPKYSRAGLMPAAWWRAALVLCWNTGLRRGTMLSLRSADLDLDAATLEVRARSNKTRKAQTVPLPPVVVAHLAAIADPTRELLLPFPHRAARLYWQFHELRRLAGLPRRPGLAWHSIRRAHATELARTNTAAAQISLGHASLSTTTRHYLQADVLRDALAKLPQPDAFTAGGNSPDQLRLFDAG